MQLSIHVYLEVTSRCVPHVLSTISFEGQALIEPGVYHLSNPADEDIINNTSVLNLRKIDVLVLRFSRILNKTNGGLGDYLHILSMPKSSDSPCPITI